MSVSENFALHVRATDHFIIGKCSFVLIKQFFYRDKFLMSCKATGKSLVVIRQMMQKLSFLNILKYNLNISRCSL